MNEEPDYRAVVVAYDASPGARAALRRAARIAEASGASLTVVMAVHTDEPEARADAREELATAVSPLPDSLEADTWVVASPAATAILAVARDVEADLLVTGSRARGPIAAALLGSVSGELARGAHCDVLIVHPREE